MKTKPAEWMKKARRLNQMSKNKDLPPEKKARLKSLTKHMKSMARLAWKIQAS